MELLTWKAFLENDGFNSSKFQIFDIFVLTFQYQDLKKNRAHPTFPYIFQL